MGPRTDNPAAVRLFVRVRDDLEIRTEGMVAIGCKTIRNNGAYDLPLSKALRNRPKHILKGNDRKMPSRGPMFSGFKGRLREWTIQKHRINKIFGVS
jgi:hypothetical protein